MMLKDCPKILFWTWTEPDKPSGSPAVLLEILNHIPKGRAEIVCEENCPKDQRKNVNIPHSISRLKVHKKLWPFRRLYSIRNYFKIASVLVLLVYGLYRIIKYRPKCLFTIYFNEIWILSSFLLSRITGIPVIFYVHDPYLEANSIGNGFSARLAKWLEPRSLGHGHVIVLYESLRHHYIQKYGVESTVVRHIATAKRKPVVRKSLGSEVTIAFAGMIYENNISLMRELANLPKKISCVRLLICTATDNQKLSEIGFASERIEVKYLRDYGELLNLLHEADLLYLPLAFPENLTSTMSSDSLLYVLPTKAIDYLLAGPPILVHCPKEYETSRFFAEFDAAFRLNSNQEDDLSNWVTNWIREGQNSIPESNVERALANFSATNNLATLERVLSKVVNNKIQYRTVSGRI